MNAVSSLATTSEVPFVDLGRHHGRDRRRAPVARSTGALRRGLRPRAPRSTRFEAEFAAFCGTRHCVGVGSGTAALTLAFLAAGDRAGRRGDRPRPHLHRHARSASSTPARSPRFCDVDDDTGLIDLRSAAEVLSTPNGGDDPGPPLRAGSATWTQLQALRRQHGLLVVEDAAQAHGARWERRPRRLARARRRVQLLPEQEPRGARRRRRDLHGRRCDRRAQPQAAQSRPAAQGRASRGRLQRAARRPPGGDAAGQAAASSMPATPSAGARLRLYRELLAGRAAARSPRIRAARCVYHLFPVRVADRDAVRASTRPERASATGVHYWPAVHRQPPFAAPRERTVAVTTSSAAVRWSEEELSLPMFAELTPDGGRCRVTDAMRGRARRRTTMTRARRPGRASRRSTFGSRRPRLLGAEPAARAGRDARGAGEVDLRPRRAASCERLRAAAIPARRRTTDVDRLLEDPEVDAIVIATPGLHPLRPRLRALGRRQAHLRREAARPLGASWPASSCAARVATRLR